MGFQQPSARITAEILSRDRDFKVQLELPRSGAQRATVNGVKQKRQSDLSEVFRCVLFSPDDLYLIKDGPAARRRFLDIALCQLRPRYALALAEYGRLYDHKSKILKSREESPGLLALLPEFTAGMARYGAAIIRYRAAVLKKLAVSAEKIHGEIAGNGERLSLFYQTVSNIEDPLAEERILEQRLLEHSQSHYEAELAAGNCLTGPHKDDFIVEIDGRNARSFASQGQTRTAALAVKFAERELMREDCGEYPVMLLDDVLSELDSRRQEYLIDRTGGGQVIITCCEKSERLKKLNAATFFVRQGAVSAAAQ